MAGANHREDLNSASFREEYAHKDDEAYPWIKAFLMVLTAPYRRTFKLYTWQPLKAFRRSHEDRGLFIALVKDWKDDKYSELQAVQVAASFCAGANLATLGWSKIPNAIWAVEALWFASLIFSIWAIITSISTKSILDDLPDRRELVSSLDEAEYVRMRRVILRYKKTPGVKHWAMMFIWQFPSMTMSYAWCTFLAGLSFYACTPFIRREIWSNNHNIAVVYLAVTGLGFCAYLFSSVFVYVGERDMQTTARISRENTNDVECIHEARTESVLHHGPVENLRLHGTVNGGGTATEHRNTRPRRQLLF